MSGKVGIPSWDPRGCIAMAIAVSADRRVRAASRELVPSFSRGYMSKLTIKKQKTLCLF